MPHLLGTSHAATPLKALASHDRAINACRCWGLKIAAAISKATASGGRHGQESKFEQTLGVHEC